MIWWWAPWFFGALGLSATIAFIGWLNSLKRKRPEPETTDMFWSKEYRQMYRSCLDYAERIYQK